MIDDKMKERLVASVLECPALLDKDGNIDWPATKAFWHQRREAIQKALSET